MVAGDEQPPLALEQADVRRGMARSLVDGPHAEVGRDLDARDEVVVRLDQLGDAGRDLPDALGVTGERLLGDAARPGDLDPAGERGRRVLGGARRVGVVGMEPEFAAGPLSDRCRLAPVIGVGMRAGEQPHMLEPEVDLIKRALELGERAGLVHAGVDEHDAGPGRDRPRVAVGNSRPRQRQPQSPQSRQDAFAASKFALTAHTAHDIGAA